VAVEARDGARWMHRGDRRRTGFPVQNRNHRNDATPAEQPDGKDLNMGIQQALVTITGNLGGPPAPFTTNAGVPACSFRVGITPRFFDQNAGQWRDRGTSWVGVCAYRTLAKNILGSLEKGDPVIVTGTLRTERWQKEGVDRSTPVIDASAVGPDLSQGIARLNKINNRRQTDAQMPEGGERAGAGADGVGGAGGAGVSGAAGPPSNPMNPAIPPNPAANVGSALGVVIDTNGIGDGAGADAGMPGESAGIDGASDPVTGEVRGTGGGDTVAPGGAGAAGGDSSDDFGDPEM